MHKEIEELIERKKKRNFEKVSKHKKKIVIFLILLVFFWIYSERIHCLNNRFIQNLDYSGFYDRYTGTYDNCNFKVINTLNLYPDSEIYAEATLENVYYEKEDMEIDLEIRVYQSVSGKLTYYLAYNGSSVKNQNKGGVMKVDENMNVDYNYEEYEQFVIDNETAIKELIETTNEFWNLELQYDLKGK